MLQRFKGLFSSSIPQSSNLNHGEGSSEMGRDEMETANGFDEVADAQPTTEEERTAVEKKERKRLKTLRKLDKKKRRQSQQAPDSSFMDSSLMGSSIMEEDAAPEMAAELEEESPAHALPSSNGANGHVKEMQEQEQEEPVEEANSKQSRKGARSRKRRSKAEAAGTSAIDNTPQPAEPMDYEIESADIVSAMKKGRLAKSQRTEAKVKKSKKSKKSNPESEVQPTVDEGEGAAAMNAQDQSDNLGQIPEKIKKAKQRSYRSPHKQSQNNAATDEDDSASNLYPSHKPAPYNLSASHSDVQEDTSEVEARIQNNAELLAFEEAANEGAAPKRPSKKALGKRKASDTAMGSNSKRRKSKVKAAETAESTEYGLISSQIAPVANDAPEPRPRSRSHSVSSQSLTKLGETAARLYASQMENQRCSPAPSDTSSLGPPPSSNYMASNMASSLQRRSTPMFTPINKAQSTSPHINSPEGNSDEPPSPQPEPSQLEPDPDPEPSVEVPAQTPKAVQPRKRGLPAGEPESSQAKTNAKRKTLSRESSAAKTPKAKTPNNSASSQVTPRPKGSRLPDDDARAIEAAVQSYRDMNDLEQWDMNALIQEDASKPKNRKFWTHMYEEVPNLPQVKILNRCRRQFHNFEARGSWTEEQDQDLKDAYERRPGKWKLIGAELNRFPEDCRDRWRNYLVCGDNQVKVSWDLREEEKLRRVVEGIAKGLRAEKQFKSSTDIYSFLDWQRVSAEMGHKRSRLQCQIKWKKMQKREEEEEPESPGEQDLIAKPGWRLESAEADANSMLPGEKLQMLYQIRDTKAGRQKSIPWYQIQQELGTSGRRMAFKIALRSMKGLIEDHEDMKLQEVVSALIDLYETAAPEEPDTWRGLRIGKSKRKRKHVSEDDNGEGSNTIKKKRKSSKTESYRANGEGPSAAATAETMDDNDKTPPVPTKRPKKLRSRMKVQNQTESQGKNDHVSDAGSDDIGSASQTMKKSKSTRKSPGQKAKKPITKARTSKRPPLSEYRVVESEDEEQVVMEEPLPNPAREHTVQPENEVQPDDEVQQEGDEDAPLDEDGQQDDESRPYLDVPPPDEPEIPESEHEMDSGFQSGQNGYMMYEDEEDIEDDEYDYTRITHDQESVDLGDSHSIAANGFNNGSSDEMDSGEENIHIQLGREESVDLDTPRKQASSPVTHSGEDDDHDDEEEFGLGVNGFNNRYVRTESISSDASSIPAVALEGQKGRTRVKSMEL
ncbi:hypothetical protein LZ554_003704 [Drepanopeziza brunnea f. sp. 'monogermtubi']|nr:hypothetical protein LZ554_003704 [Drepanopeziza brunnea f. sp. 'monogermtubi']